MVTKGLGSLYALFEESHVHNFLCDAHTCTPRLFLIYSLFSATLLKKVQSPFSLIVVKVRYIHCKCLKQFSTFACYHDETEIFFRKKHIPAPSLCAANSAIKNTVPLQCFLYFPLYIFSLALEFWLPAACEQKHSLLHSQAISLLLL